MSNQSNVSDLVERLRCWRISCAEANEAADEIERLRAQLAAAEAEKLELANHADGCVRVAAEALQGRQTAESQLDAARKTLEWLEIRCRNHGFKQFERIASEALRTLTPGAGK